MDFFWAMKKKQNKTGTQKDLHVTPAHDEVLTKATGNHSQIPTCERWVPFLYFFLFSDGLLQ